jgi:hypothetical protein
MMVRSLWTTTLEPILCNFWNHFAHSFCKLDYFIIAHYFPITLKWTSLLKILSKFTPKFVNRVGSTGVYPTNNFLVNSLTLFGKTI